jgi:hypothetical protein
MWKIRQQQWAQAWFVFLGKSQFRFFNYVSYILCHLTLQSI